MLESGDIYNRHVVKEIVDYVREMVAIVSEMGENMES
jgi:hypothetical protein